MKHRIEIFSPGCNLCKETISLVEKLAGTESDVVVHDILQVELAGCCTGRGPDEPVLRDALR